MSSKVNLPMSPSPCTVVDMGDALLECLASEEARRVFASKKSRLILGEKEDRDSRVSKVCYLDSLGLWMSTEAPEAHRRCDGVWDDEARNAVKREKPDVVEAARFIFEATDGRHNPDSIRSIKNLAVQLLARKR